MMRHVLLSRRGASNILATLMIFLITTVAITYFVVQVNPILTGIVHEKESSTQRITALNLADEIEKMSLAPINGVRSIQVSNPYSSYFSLGFGPQLTIELRDGASSLYTQSLTLGILNLTTVEDFTGSTQQPTYIRGGISLSSMFLNETRDTTQVQVIVGEQSKNEQYRDFILVRGLITASTQGTTGTLDLFVYKLTFDSNQQVYNSESLSFLIEKTVILATTTLTSTTGFTSISLLQSLNAQALTPYSFPAFTGLTTLNVNFNIVALHLTIQSL